jgi:hypothetical protein
MAKKSTAQKDLKGWLRAAEWGLILAAAFITISSTPFHMGVR